MMIEPCPFCGFDNIGIHTNLMGYSQMECNRCGAGGPLDRNDSHELKWNERHSIVVPLKIDMGYEFALRWAKAKGWRIPRGEGLPEEAWINYWLNMERYEEDPSTGRPVVPHRT